MLPDSKQTASDQHGAIHFEEYRRTQRNPGQTINFRFGSEVLLLSEANTWPDLKADFQRSGIAIKTTIAIPPQEQFVLIQQKGRLFQRHFPDATILYDRGRYMAVSLTQEQYRQAKETSDPCFRILPIEESATIFATHPRLEKTRAGEIWIQNLVDGVSETSYLSYLTQLTSYNTRHSYSTTFDDAASWAREQFNAMGYATALQNFNYSGHTIVNVIATKSGTQISNRNLVLVVAHLDSINVGGSVSSSAPGADDNASGSAGLLHMAWLLRNHGSLHDIRFILFGGEEQGLRGSQYYIEQLGAAEKARISAVINMDMIACHNTVEYTVLLEGATLSQPLIDKLLTSAETYTGLTIETSISPYASDHVPFINANIPAVLTIEGSDSSNGNVHSASDTLDTLDLELGLEILRMNIATIADHIGKKGEITMPNLEYSDLQELVPDFLDILEKYPPLLRFQYSGRYVLNGGASARETNLRLDNRITSIKALSDPTYKLEKPVYLDEIVTSSSIWDYFKKIRCTLHIDIDGTDPLNVVSGTVAKGLYTIGVRPLHFIGQVTSNTYSGGVRHLVVENFSFTWPGTSNTINRLNIDLTGNYFQTPVADVTFVGTAGVSYGPYSITRESIYFREVEIEIDMEDGAVNVASYNTHTHPDRPADIRNENLSLESVFKRSGILITRSSESNTINSSDAGSNSRWNYSELHDAMEEHWSAFANRPQWKMWLFMAELADSDSLGGVMFDGDIDEPGGVDRQGTAIFTKCPYFHTTTGGYIVANPPVDEAVQRELFFNTIHESGHAFNLAHSWQKTNGNEWDATSWMPVANNDDALSWMNYPDRPSPGANATWFYERFRFRFDDNENLFLRHAPQSYVRMGDSAWFENHGRVTRSSLDQRLSLNIRTLKPVFEFGEPINIEIKLQNTSDTPVLIHQHLDPCDGLIDIAITAPDGTRTPLVSLLHARVSLNQVFLEPRQAIYQSVNVTVGKMGFNFKLPGAYRIEAAYKNVDGRTAAAVSQLYVRAAQSVEDQATINELFDARVARVLYIGGSRIMEDVNDKFNWISKRLGETHPLQFTLSALQANPYVNNFKLLRADSVRIKLLDEDPDYVERKLRSAFDNIGALADSIGHINTRALVDSYTNCAIKIKKDDNARKTHASLLEMFKSRDVVPNVIEELEIRQRAIKKSGSKGSARKTETA